MLSGKDLKVAVWLHLVENPSDLTDHLKALVDIALEGNHGHGDTITKTAIKGVRAKVAARTGEPKTTATLPDYVKGSGTSANPYRIEYPGYFLKSAPLGYTEYTKAELYRMGADRGLEVRTRMTKAELIAALEAAD